jgi:hypothetical protein
LGNHNLRSFSNDIKINISEQFYLRTKPASIILFGLAFVDNGFLVALLAIGLKELGVNIFDKYESGCQLIVYFSYVFSFLSAW